MPPSHAPAVPVNVRIRASQDGDVAAITAIYRHHVLHGTGTFEIEPPTEADMVSRRADVLSRNLPYLVADDPASGRVLGFAYCNWFKPRPAYRFSAEDSIYVAADCPRQGIGQQLLLALCEQARAAGVRQMLAVIGDSANAGSIGVHRRCGFEPVGVLRSCGWKMNRWLDVVMMQKALGPGAQTPPRVS